MKTAPANDDQHVSLKKGFESAAVYVKINQHDRSTLYFLKCLGYGCL